MIIPCAIFRAVPVTWHSFARADLAFFPFVEIDEDVCGWEGPDIETPTIP